MTRLLLDLDGEWPHSARRKRTLRFPADMQAIRDACPHLEELNMFLPLKDLDIVSTILQLVHCALTPDPIPSS